MMKKSAKTALYILAAVLFSLPASAQGDWKKETEKAVSIISEDQLHREISFLTDSLCNGRATGTKGATEAAFWISRKFEKAGLLPVENGYGLHFVTQTGAPGHNIIGMIPGALTMPRNRYIIIGAHYDHLGVLNGKMFPGADANASGVTAMLSLAQMFSSMRTLGKGYDSNIIFVAFDAKELSMTGSQAVWRMIKDGDLHDPVTGESITPEKIMLMVNIDQVGSTLSPLHNNRPDYLIMLGTHSLKHSDQGLLEYCNRRYGLYMDIALDYYGSKNFTDVFYTLSDQKIFVQNRIPAVLFTSGITMNTNKTWDTVENLDMGVLKKRIYLIYHWLDHIL